jgi:hypothetical protein
MKEAVRPMAVYILPESRGGFSHRVGASDTAANCEVFLQFEHL